MLASWARLAGQCPFVLLFYCVFKGQRLTPLQPSIAADSPFIRQRTKPLHPPIFQEGGKSLRPFSTVEPTACQAIFRVGGKSHCTPQRVIMATHSHAERTPKTQAKHKSEKFIFILSKKHLLPLFVMVALQHKGSSLSRGILIFFKIIS